METTKFRIVFPSAQQLQPGESMVSKGIQIFLEDGTEIHGCISIEGPTHIAFGTRVKLEFYADNFTFET